MKLEKNYIFYNGNVIDFVSLPFQLVPDIGCWQSPRYLFYKALKVFRGGACNVTQTHNYLRPLFTPKNIFYFLSL